MMSQELLCTCVCVCVCVCVGGGGGGREVEFIPSLCDYFMWQLECFLSTVLVTHYLVIAHHHVALMNTHTTLINVWR